LKYWIRSLPLLVLVLNASQFAFAQDTQARPYNMTRSKAIVFLEVFLEMGFLIAAEL
jgi:hypothetical protein